jgi:hypothetical protein
MNSRESSTIFKKNTAEVVSSLRKSVIRRLKPYFELTDVCFPPSGIALIGLKKERQLELWANSGGEWSFIRTYHILGASGGSGPKLKEGDRQVPEGIYKVTMLNPNSKYYLSMKLDYPNEFDLEKAALEGRSNVGGDIFIHGGESSVGCLAIGDAAIEEIFVLAAIIGIENIEVVIAPNDIRKEEPLLDGRRNISWLDELYEIIKVRLAIFIH